MKKFLVLLLLVPSLGATPTKVQIRQPILDIVALNALEPEEHLQIGLYADSLHAVSSNFDHRGRNGTTQWSWEVVETNGETILHLRFSRFSAAKAKADILLETQEITVPLNRKTRFGAGSLSAQIVY